MFDFDQLPEIIGLGIEVIERELKILVAKSEKEELSDPESKKLIAYMSVLREIKRDYAAEVAAVQKELKAMSTEELSAMLQQN